MPFDHRNSSIHPLTGIVSSGIYKEDTGLSRLPLLE
jgi:hypothetical protein